MSCFADDSDTYTVSDCAAACIDYKYFSIEDNEQCFCENCLLDATQYNKRTNCTGNGLGGTWAMDLYENSKCVEFVQFLSIYKFIFII